jgi:dTDP-glucose 4,6-dehydratase
MMRAIVREFQPDTVIHLAASAEEDPARLFETELAGAIAVMEASSHHHSKLTGEARDRFRVVHAIRAEADAAETPAPSPVEAARASAASVIDNWSRAQKLPLVTCVAAEVFGPYQSDKAFLPSMMASLLAGRVFAVPHGGETIRDWLPVRDFASGLLRAGEVAPSLSRFEFSVGAERRDLDVADGICAMLDARSPLPNGAAWNRYVQPVGDAAGAPQGPMLDEREAERDIEWRPMGFHAGLDRALTWAIGRYSRPVAAAVAAE